MNKNGFTLVELSIVLVIIGLLIGGILVGQSLIESAKINAFIQQIRQYDIAISNFKGKYKSIPGDGTLFSPSGNNDGRLSANSTILNDDMWNYEISYAWYHLSQAGILNKKYNYNTPNNLITINYNIPQAKIGDSAGILLTYGAEGPNCASCTVNDYWSDNYYHIFKMSPDVLTLNNGGTSSDAISVADTLAVDQKVDDGNAALGNVRAAAGNEQTRAAVNRTAAGGTGCVLTSNTSIYNTNSSAATPCSMVILIGQI